MSRESLLTLLIFLGLVFGAIVGQFLFDPSWDATTSQASHQHAGLLGFFEVVGFTVFMGLLKMLIIPLIAASVLTAVTSVGDFGQLGKMGGWTLAYYFGTMVVAVVIGLFVVTTISPGTPLAESATGISEVSQVGVASAEKVASAAQGGLMGVFKNLLGLMFPTNIFKAMAEGQTLSVIVFFIFFGVVITLLGETAKPLVILADAITNVMMKMVELVLWTAPLGVFCLLAWTVARIGVGVFGESIGVYMLTVLLGLAIHGFLVLPLILWVFGKANPFRFMYAMRSAIMMALGTSSSSATLPVTIECATTEGGVSKKSAGLVLPLGATINMDGTALYEAVAVVFMAQATGIHLGMSQLIIIAVTATLAAVGAAGIPSAGLVTMVIVVDAVNQSLSAASPTATLIPVAAIGLVIGVDRLLDMVRTAVNLWGDAVGAKIITRLDN